jgi:hypothetical protein
MKDTILFRAHAATTDLDSTLQRFTPEAVKQLAASVPGKLVTQNFDSRVPPVGHVVSAEITEQGLMLDVELACSPLGGVGASRPPLYVVPGFIVHQAEERDGVLTFIEVEATDFGLTDKPSDKHLHPIEEINLNA